jgi:hypothetical protein
VIPASFFSMDHHQLCVLKTMYCTRDARCPTRCPNQSVSPPLCTVANCSADSCNRTPLQSSLMCLSVSQVWLVFPHFSLNIPSRWENRLRHRNIQFVSVGGTSIWFGHLQWLWALPICKYERLSFRASYQILLLNYLRFILEFLLWSNQRGRSDPATAQFRFTHSFFVFQL